MDASERQRWRDAVTGGPEEVQRALGPKLLPDVLRSVYRHAPRRSWWADCSYFGFDGSPVSLLEWSEAFGKNAVCSSLLSDDVYISTSYLGVDHGYDGETPLIFETMVFRGAQDGERWHWADVESARIGHSAIAWNIEQEARARLRAELAAGPQMLGGLPLRHRTHLQPGTRS